MSTLLSEAMDRLRADLRHEPIEKRVRAMLGDRVLVDSTEALLVYEPRRICPVYAFPEPAVRAELRPTGPVTPGGPDFLHPGVPFAVHSTPGTSLTVVVNGDSRPEAAFRPDDPALAGYVILDFDAFTWLEEDEPVRAHPRDLYHAIDVRASSRHLRIADGDRLLVDTVRPVLLFETSLPTRFYVPRADVVANLTPGKPTTYCPYKGEASYWSVNGRDDIAWSYQHPLADAAQIAGLIAFWDDVLDVTLDGVVRGRPDTAVATAMRDEFNV